MKTLINLFLSLFILTGFQNIAVAQNVSMGQARELAEQFLRAQKGTQNSIAEGKLLLSEEDALANAYLFTLKPQGFIVISSTNPKSPVLAYSLEHDFASENPFEIETSLSFIREIIYNDLHALSSRGVSQTDVLYGPYVHTMWGQVNCHDVNGKLINVTNLFTPNHYAAGCVAISQASILHHYTWPPKGVGTYTYTDNSGSNRGTYTADFGNTEYQWPLALERYRSKASTTEQREAAGEVAYHCAVSLSMDFESNGSTSNVNRIPTALANHFRFTALYRSRSSSTFWTLLDSNMVYKKPVVLAVENNSGGGHSVVCDGLRIDDDGSYYYHLNMGWWGVSNGWYKIRGSFDAGSYTTIIGGTMNIIPEPMIEVPEIWSDSIEFDLKWSYPEKAEAEAFEVQKSIDNGDWITLTDETTDTLIHLVVDPEKEYKFRVRAKTNGKWYQNSWSKVTELKRKYVGIEDNPLRNTTLFPNPFTNRLTINLTSQQQGFKTITVFNITGQVINRVYVDRNKTVINTESWNSGLYFIKIKSGNYAYSFKAIKN